MIVHSSDYRYVCATRSTRLTSSSKKSCLPSPQIQPPWARTASRNTSCRRYPPYDPLSLPPNPTFCRMTSNADSPCASPRLQGRRHARRDRPACHTWDTLARRRTTAPWSVSARARDGFYRSVALSECIWQGNARRRRRGRCRVAIILIIPVGGSQPRRDGCCALTRWERATGNRGNGCIGDGCADGGVDGHRSSSRRRRFRGLRRRCRGSLFGSSGSGSGCSRREGAMRGRRSCGFWGCVQGESHGCDRHRARRRRR